MIDNQEMQGPFIIDDIAYSKEELISFSENMLKSERRESWKSDLYQFIIYFFDEDVSLTQRTSGTTGDPKVLGLDRNSMIRSAQMTLKYFDLKVGNSTLLCLPVQYIAGKMMIVRALIGGLNLITVEPTGRPLEKLSRKIDFAAMVPLQLIETIANNHPIDKIKKLLVGGGEVNEKLLGGVQELDQTEVYETFAMSETYTHFAVKRINGNTPDVYFEVLDGVALETDDRGCLVVDVPGVTNGKIISNDLVKMHGKTGFEYLGRIDNVIKSGGIKIIPEILEKKIQELIVPGYKLIGLPDPKLGQKVVLVVESESEIKSKDSKKVKDLWMSRMTGILQKHELPKEIIIISKFPRNASMKIDMQELLKLLNKKSSPSSLKDLVSTPFKKSMFIVQILSYFLIVGSPFIGGGIGKMLELKTATTAGVIFAVFLIGEILFYGSLAFLGKEVVLLLRNKMKSWFKKRKSKT